MRLIDKDRLLKGSNHYWLEMENFGDIEAIDVRFIEMADEVKAIPIDKPFLKMRYGDYVVYNKKWLVNHLQTEWNILQGKEYQPSIPIEWIKKQVKDGWYDIIEIMYHWEIENNIKESILWSEENEKSSNRD